MASMVLGSLGSKLAGPLGGMLGSAAGGYIDKWLFGPTTEGPRIDDLTVVRADPGVPIPLVYGADRVPGIVIGTTDLIETKHKENMMGKGGGGTISYTYHVDIDFMLSEGPILGVGRIWAEGNLIRGTRYELDADTAEYPEQIGGIPYPRYYRDHLYSPKLIPWSIIRDYTETDDGKFYKASSDMTQMLQITEAEATDLLENTIQVVYWKDTATGYYIPLHESHTYTGESLQGGEPSPMSAVFGEFSKMDSIGLVFNPIPGPVIDLGHTVSDDADFEAVLSYSIPWSVQSSSFWKLAYLKMRVRFDYFAEGNSEYIDGNALGENITPSYLGSWVRLAEGGTLLQGTMEGDSIVIPPGTRYIVPSHWPINDWPVFAVATNSAGLIRVSFNDAEVSADVRDWPDYWNLYDAINDWSKKAVLSYIGPENVTLYPGHRTQIPDPTMEAAIGLDVPAYIGRAHMVFDRLELADYGNRIPSLQFEVVQYDDARIADVIVDMMERANVAPEYYDVSELPNDNGVRSHILGYTVATKTDYRAAMEAILEPFRVDAAEIGNSLVFREKDRLPDYTIDYSELGAVESGEKPGDLVKLSFRSGVDMPRSLTVSFKDVERNYQQNTARFARRYGASVSDISMEIPAVIPPRFAKGFARDKMRDLWLEKASASFQLQHKHVYLYPSDILTIVDTEGLGRSTINMKLTSVTRGANGLLEVEGVLREQTLYVPDADEIDRVDTDKPYQRMSPPVTNVIPFSLLYMMDLPPLNEKADDNGFYFSMGTGSTGVWPGATLYRSTDDDSSFGALESQTQPATLGRIFNSTLLDGQSEYIDHDSVVNVRLYSSSDTLESTTVSGLFAGRNACVIGDEVVQFLTAERLDNGSWNLSTFMRGRRGTDDPTILAGHSGFERFVLLETGLVKSWEDPIIRNNVAYSYKAVSTGATVAGTASQEFTNTGKRITPLSPIHITGARDEANNLIISWTRRDRVYQALVDGSDIANAEAFEKYEVDILNNNTGAVVRTLRVSDLTQVVYTAAMHVEDGLTLGIQRTVKVYQMSAVVGRGNAGVARV